MLFGVPEIVGQLIAQPRFRRAPTGLSRRSAMSAEIPFRPLSNSDKDRRDTPRPLAASVTHSLTGLTKAILANNFARMWAAYHNYSLLSG